MATILLEPSATSVAAGKTISVQVVVNAAGSPLVSSQFQMSYPASVLAPVSFTFAPGWIQSNDAGYNVMSGGTVIQSGGYAASFRGTMTMGTLTFQALKPGEATLAISGSNTFAFETDGGNLFTGPLASAQISVGPGTNVAAPVPKVSTAGAAQEVTPSAIPSVFSGATQSASAASGSISFAGIPLGFWILAVLIGISFFAYRAFKKKRSKRRR